MDVRSLKQLIVNISEEVGFALSDDKAAAVAKDVVDSMDKLRRCGPLSPAEVEPGMFVTVLSWNPAVIASMFGSVEHTEKMFVGDVLKVEAISIPFLACVHVETDDKVSLDMRRLTVGELSAEYVEAMEDKEEE